MARTDKLSKIECYLIDNQHDDMLSEWNDDIKRKAAWRVSWFQCGNWGVR